MNASSSDIGKKLSRSKYPPLGALAIHYGTLTPMQMDDAMEAVAKRKGLPADLPEILVEMGFTTHQQIDLLKALLEYHHTREAGVRFGSIAIEKGYATEKDIEEALNIQIRLFRETKQNKRMGDIMVSEGIISPEERDLVLDELKKREKIDSEPVAKPGKSRFEESFLETRRKDELFAKIVLEKRYATESQVNHARMVQKALGESTKQIKLVGEILVEKGTLSMEQFSDILSSQGRSREINEINSKISPFVTVTVSRDHTQVQVSPAGLMPEGEMAELIVKTLKDQGIIHGILPLPDLKKEIETFRITGKPFTAARGKKAVPGKPPKIRIKFKRKTHAGGFAPPVRKGSVLAEIVPGITPVTGITVYGKEISVPLPSEVSAKCGHGAKLSEDGTRVLAGRDGIPSISVDGTFTVAEKISVTGDTSYRVPLSDSRGNINVSGTLFQEKTVQGCDISADEIRRTGVNAVGDINIETGITDAKISCQGSIRAKYIHNSVVDAFGDIIIENEIIDSTITTSGELRSVNSKIISSTIAARKGIYASGIGTPVSEPCLLKLGVDDHIQKIAREIDLRIAETRREMDELDDKNKSLAVQKKKLIRSITIKKQLIDKIKNASLPLIKSHKQWVTAGEETKAAEAMLKLAELRKRLEKETGFLKKNLAAHKEVAKACQETEARLEEIRQPVTREVNKLEKQKQAHMEWASTITPVPLMETRGKVSNETRISCSRCSIKLTEDKDGITVTEEDIKGSTRGEGTLRVKKLP